MKKMFLYSREVSYNSTDQLDEVLNNEVKSGGILVAPPLMLNAQSFYGLPANRLLCIFKKDVEDEERPEGNKDVNRL